jgi:hypothetical protein
VPEALPNSAYRLFDIAVLMSHSQRLLTLCSPHFCFLLLAHEASNIFMGILIDFKSNFEIIEK